MLLLSLTFLAGPAAAADPRVYVVRPGDTLWAIASRFDTTVAALVKANSISNPDLIFVGQQLYLPGDSTAEVAPPAPSPSPPAQPKRPAVQQHRPIKALYMTFFAIGSQSFREHAFNLIQNSELNAIVIDVKGDRGYLAIPTQVALAETIGATRYPTMKDVEELMAYFKANGIYTMARVVVFKDNPLARARPDLAVRDSRTGGLWIDNEGLAWTDPFRKEVWDYNIAIAREAAARGFDEIQFDYIRFPTDGYLQAAVFSQPSTQQSRLAAIGGFLAQAKKVLKPLGVRLAVDTFGYATWREDDMGIGQKLEELAKYVDVISPMVYPSTFGHGIPGYAYAVAYPYEIVNESVKRAIRRVGDKVEVRPWLQDFPDYAFDRRPYGVQEVLAQKKGAYDAGATGWMLWDPRVRYTPGALGPP